MLVGSCFIIISVFCVSREKADYYFPPDATASSEDVRVSDEPQTAFEWLETNRSPGDDVESNWTLSYPCRQQLLKTGISHIEYFETLPCLKTPLGSKLKDFKLMHPASKDLLVSWEENKKLIVQLLEEKPSVSLTHRGLLQSLPGLLEDDQNSVIISLLPLLITAPTPKRQKDGAYVRLTAQEKLDAFYIHVDREDQIDAALSIQRTKVAAANPLFPPIPILVGPIAKLITIFACMNDNPENPTKYRVKSVIHAIDLCMQSFLVLRCSPQYYAKKLWLWIQQGLYDIKLPKDKCTTSINSLLGLMKAPPKVAAHPIEHFASEYLEDTDSKNS